MSHRLLAVHAHPDDESLTMAGTLALAVAGGARVTLITATLGEQGEVIGEELQGLVADRADQLGGYRYTELRSACAALGITDHRMLGGIGAFRDSGMVGTPAAGHPRALARAAAGGPDHQLAVAALVGVIDEIRPDVLLTYDADGGYGHPDHVAVHQVCVAATRAGTTGVGTAVGGAGDGTAGGFTAGDSTAGDSTAGDSTAGDGTGSAAHWRTPRALAVVRPRSATHEAFRHFTTPDGYLTAGAEDVGFLAVDDEIAVAVPIAEAREARRAALAAHATQVELIAGGFALSNRIAQPLLDFEYYRLLAGEPPPRQPDGSPAADIFGGLE